MLDRISRVARIRISPPKFLGYIGETVTFTALGADSLGEVVHGVKFSWESSHTSKIRIDEAGRATFLEPGLTQIICRAGASLETARVLIRPTRRPKQTDQEWRDDQRSIDSSSVSSLLDQLAPSVQTQSGGFGNDIGASASTQEVGRPPLKVLAIIPKVNYLLGVPLVSLGGRGLGTNLALYLNSNVWGRRTNQYQAVMTFDPIQSWPAPGLTLGLGRLVYWAGPNDPMFMYNFMWVDPDGTRHALGMGH